MVSKANLRAEFKATLFGV